ncbi:MAG TPA: fused MFS/spermidine synthase [archaeon]|nr:fused MFS/spermidine synthase [archaeon]
MKEEKKFLVSGFYLLFFLSGVSGLVYQALWLRMFTLVLGNSLYSANIVFSAFMCGLALGALFFGRYIKGKRDIIPVYIFLELGIAVTAVTVGKAIPHLSALVPYFFRLFSSSSLFLNLFRLSVSFLILLLPTVLIGGTLPVLTHFLTHRLEVAGRRIGALYGWNTVGAVLGCAVTGFWLIRVAGMAASLYAAAAINLFVALAALVLRVYSRRIPPAASKKAQRASDRSSSFPANFKMRRLLLAAAGITGAASLAYEIVWARFLSYIMYNDIYAYYLMLSTMLLGIGLGSLLYSRWLDRLKNKLLWLAALEISLGLLVGICYLFCAMHYRWEGSSLWIKSIQNFFADLSLDPFYAYITIKLFYALTVMFLPTMIMGIVFPMICRLYFADEKTVGSDTGSVYAVNTAGAIIGVLVCGFLLVPRLGVQPSLFIMAALNLALGSTILFYEGQWSQRKFTRELPFYITAALAFCLICFLPVNQVRKFALKNKKHTQLIFYKEGLSGTVAVVKDKINDTKTLYINAIAEVHNSFAGMLTFKMLGHLPLLLHSGDPQKVLMVTFGGGIASGAVASHPVEELDVVELEPAVLEASAAYAAENRGVLSDPRIRIHIGDGRNHLSTTDKLYDAIISDATNPGSSDSWVLYTLEFYNLCRARLSPGGIMAQWLPWHTGTQESYCTIVKTFQTVFPHTTVWFLKDYSLLIGLPESLTISYPDLLKKISVEPVRSDLAPYCLDRPLELLDCFLIGESSAREMVKDARISTDNLPFYQLAVTEQAEPGRILSMLYQYRERVFPLVRGVEGARAQALRDSLDVYYRSEGCLIRKDFPGAIRENPSSCKVERFYQVYQEEVSYVEAVADYDPENYYLQLRAGVSLVAHREYSKARGFFSRLAALDPGDVSNYVNLGNLDFELGDYDSSIVHYQKAFEMGRKDVDLLSKAGRALLVSGKPDKALVYLTEAVQLDGDNESALLNLGYCYSRLGKPDQAAECFVHIMRLNPDNPAALVNLGMIYLGQERTEQAGKLFERAVDLAPENYSAWMGLGISLFRSAQYGKSAEAFGKALEINPQNQQAKQYLETIQSILAGN